VTESTEPFDAAVERVLHGLQRGDLVTYGEVAAEAGYPRHARAVGRLLAGSDGRWPWWRVVTSSGRLVPGLEAEHGRRLEAEGHRVEGGRVRRPSTAGARAERFDQRYFERWYREEDFGAPDRLAHKIDFALAATEYLLDRPVGTVLDVGCGEGEWQPALLERRPDLTYLGVDPSRYAVERYGQARNLRLGGIADLDDLVARDQRFDLVVCVDVLGYVPDREVRAGLDAISRRLGGLALIELYTSDDDIVGDLDEFRRRRLSTYRRWFAEAGLHRIGPHLYCGEVLLPTLSDLERPVT
jgi:alkylated DNA nucleotide flippase Atl1/SAM-dependent methyltransferase